MELTNERSIELITLYEGFPELWQPDHKYYFNKLKRNDAWEAIASQFETTSEIAKTKMTSLLASYRREKNKEESSKGTGKGTDEIYRSKWFAYEAFGFLKDKNKCKKTINSCTSQNASQENDSEEIQSARASTSNEQLIELEAENNIGSPSQEPAQAEQHSAKPTATKRKKKSAPPLSQVDQVVDILQHSLRRDDCDVYGEHVAMKLKKYSSRTQALVQHYMNDILFQADMGRYDVPENNTCNKNQTIPPTHSVPPSPAISPHPHQHNFSINSAPPPHFPTTIYTDSSLLDDPTSMVLVVGTDAELDVTSETGSAFSTFQI